ncbi:MAG: hypothetical protein IPK33_07080 [Gemmatimonadetes bacterium]|nr:hypothetical protein [Gemmatimonadota bacterium]
MFVRPSPAGSTLGSSFINFASTDNGVGTRTTRDRSVTYSSVNCSGVTATDVAMPSGTGADINNAIACPTNFIGGTPGLGGTAPWTVKGSESDRLNNRGTSSATQTFGTDYTVPDIRWGLIDAGLAIPVAYGGTASGTVDSVFYATKPSLAPVNAAEFRAEYLDDRAGFYNAGDYDAVFDVAAQSHHLSTAGHLNPIGLCVVAAAGSTPGSTFVTDPSCGFTPITVGVPGVRTDGWQPGQRVDIPDAEGYYGYKTWVMDAAGNTSATLFRRALVNNQSPFSTGLGVPATLTGSTFIFNATHADSAEVIAQSLQLAYPAAPRLDSLPSRLDSNRLRRRHLVAAGCDDLADARRPWRPQSWERRGVFPAASRKRPECVTYATQSATTTQVVVERWNRGSMIGGQCQLARRTSPFLRSMLLTAQVLLLGTLLTRRSPSTTGA